MTGSCRRHWPVQRRDADVSGIAVHIGARIGSIAAPGEILVSSTVKDLVTGSGITFADRGRHALKGNSRRLAGVGSVGLGAIGPADNTVGIANWTCG